MNIPSTGLKFFAVTALGIGVAHLAGCSAVAEDDPAGAAASEEKFSACTIAPASLAIRNAKPDALPIFASATWATEGVVSKRGNWQHRDAFPNPFSGTSIYDPNRIAGWGHLALDNAPEAGAFVQWNLGILPNDQGKTFSVYTYLPEAANASKAYYRIYDGRSTVPQKTIETNQATARTNPASVTLSGKTYTLGARGAGWVFLGKLPLYSGARVSLDAAGSVGRLVADTVVAVKWGCAEVD